MPLPISVPDLTQEDLQPQMPTPEGGLENRVKQFGYGIEDAFDKSGAVFDPEKFLMEHLNPGPIVHTEDLPQNLQKEYPNGVGQNVLNLINDNKTHDDFVDRQLSYAPQGPLNDVSQFGAGVIGTMFNPVNALATALAPEASLERIIANVGSATKAGNFLLHGAKSALIGEGVNTVANLNNYFYDKQLGNNPDPGEIFNNWKLAGAIPFLAGGLYGLTKPTRVAGATADADTLNTAVNQISGDKPVDVGPQVQQSMYEQGQAMQNSGFDVDAAQQNSDALGEKIAAINDQLDQSEDIPGLSDQLGVGKLNQINDNLRRSESLSQSEMNFNDNLLSFSYFNKLQNITSKHPDLLTDPESDFLSKFVNDETYERSLLKNEQSLNNDNINKTQDYIDTINQDSLAHRMNIGRINSQIDNFSKDQYINDFLSERGLSLEGISKDKNNLDELNKRLDGLEIGKSNKRRSILISNIQELEDKVNENNKAISNANIEANNRIYELGKERLDAVNELSSINTFKDDHLSNLDHFNKVKKLIKIRMKSLNNALSDRNKLMGVVDLEKAKHREELKIRKNFIQNAKDYEDAQISAATTRPVEKSDVLGTVEKLRDPTNDIAFQNEDDSRIDEDIPDGRPSEEVDFTKEVKDQIKKGNIRQELVDQIDKEHAGDPEKIKTATAKIDEYVACRMGE